MRTVDSRRFVISSPESAGAPIDVAELLDAALADGLQDVVDA